MLRFQLKHPWSVAVGPFCLGVSRPGVVTAGWGFVLLHDCWMYGPCSWWQLPGEVWVGWKADRNLVG